MKIPHWESKRTYRRYKRHIFTDPETGCWEWTGALVKGYGRMFLGRKYGYRDVHRYMAERKVGRALQQDEFVLHQCDNPICSNPDHLEVGTHQENMEEMKVRKRAATGERNAMTSLTRDQVERIRAAPAWMTHTELGKQFGVSRHTVARIRRGETWST